MLKRETIDGPQDLKETSSLARLTEWYFMGPKVYPEPRESQEATKRSQRSSETGRSGNFARKERESNFNLAIFQNHRCDDMTNGDCDDDTVSRIDGCL